MASCKAEISSSSCTIDSRNFRECEVWLCYFDIYKVKVKWSRYRPGVAQRVGRGIALLFHDRGTGRWWVVSITPRPHFTAGERTGTHFTWGWVGHRAGLDGRKISPTTGIRSRTVQLIAHSLYRLSYPAHIYIYIYIYIYICVCVCVCVYGTLRRRMAILVGESCSRPLGRHGRRWEDNIKVELKVTIKRDIAEGGQKRWWKHGNKL
jgi:hypothetical protein